MLIRANVNYTATLDPATAVVMLCRDGEVLGTGRWTAAGLVNVSATLDALPREVVERLDAALRCAITAAVMPGLEALESVKRSRAHGPAWLKCKMVNTDNLTVEYEVQPFGYPETITVVAKLTGVIQNLNA